MVSTVNGAPPKRGRPSATSSRRWASWNGEDTCTNFPTDSRGGILQREPTTPNTPACGHAARWWPRSQEDGKCERTEAGKQQATGGSTRKRWGQRNVGEEGTNVNGSPDMRRECDLKRACSV